MWHYDANEVIFRKPKYLDLFAGSCIYILVAWQGHRGDQKRKKTPSQILLKAPKPNAAARTLYYKNVCFFPFKIKGVPNIRFGQKIKKNVF